MPVRCRQPDAAGVSSLICDFGFIEKTSLRLIFY